MSRRASSTSYSRGGQKLPLRFDIWDFLTQVGKQRLGAQALSYLDDSLWQRSARSVRQGI
jgi:hypothetical protein